MNDRAVMIGLDWGTTSLRAYRIGTGGRVLGQRSAAAGILQVPEGDFAGTLTASVGDWLEREPDLPVLAAGMIGSRQGWREVPYVPCPAGLDELARGLTPVTGAGGRMVHLVPGVARAADPTGFPDVMRGEETQILGASGAAGGQHCFVLPGTHSKWAWAEREHIARFATYMTGEVYACLVQHSILGRLMTGHDADPAAFEQGLARAHASAGDPPGRLLHDLFSARTLGLFATIPPAGLASYLSGLLIGAEVVAALAGSRPDAVTILGSSALGPLYAQAIAASGGQAVVGDTDAAAHGLHAIARAAGMLEESSLG